jgi:ubiquinone/menaquinone biosynthesis C-methylase UbiE
MMNETTLQPTETRKVTPPAHVWDKAADGWNLHESVIRGWLAPVTQAMMTAAGIAPGARVLDIAAGSGSQTLDIARRVGSSGTVLATDISSRCVALAWENAQLAGLPQIQSLQADAQSLGLATSGFDAAVSRLGLMFCAEPLKAFVEARKALKPGGRFAAVVFSTPQSNPCVALMMATALKAAGAPARSPYAPGALLSLGQPGRLADLLSDAGFADVHVQAIAAPFELPSARHYVDFVRASGSPIMEILAHLPEDAQAAAWADMETQLKVFDSDAGWVGPNELLLGSATAP